MATEARAAGVEEVHILWISEGMSCDGDSVSVTAAMQPVGFPAIAWMPP